MIECLYLLLGAAGVLAGAGLVFLLITWRVRAATGGRHD